MRARRREGGVGPRLPRALLRRLLPTDLRAEVIHDLGERWSYLRERDGRLRAALWYWRQALRSWAPAAPRPAESPGRTLVHELGDAARQVLRTPGFTTAVVITLALGIGATSAVFSVVNGVLLDPLPYPDARELVRVYSADATRADEHNVVSGSHFLAFRERPDLFAGLAAFYDYNELGADLTGDSGPERIIRMPISANYFDVLGTALVLGDGFEPADEIGSEAGVAVISHALWTRRYGGDPGVLGEALALDGSTYRVVGVAPSGFVGPNGEEVAVWTPLDMRPGGSNDFDNHYLSVVGRLARGVGAGAAGQALDALNASLAEQSAEARLELAHVVPLLGDIVGDARAMLMLLMGSVGLVLVIVCVNVANLFLMRGTDRVHEIAVRAALGAGRGRLLGQLLAEGLLRALAGGAIGVALGSAAVRVLLALSPDSLPRTEGIGLDATVLAFALATTLATGLLFSIVPALRFSRPSASLVLRDADRTATAGGAQSRLRGGLVAGQVAVALALLVAAGALIDEFVAIQRSRLGIDPRGVSTFEVHLPSSAYGEGTRRVLFNERLLESIRGIDGVDAAGAATVLPVTGRSYMWGLFGKDHPEGERPLLADVRVIAGDYFAALGVELRQGRFFGPADRGADSPPVAIVNERVVDTYLGEGFRLGDPVRLAGVQRQIVGVVENTAVDPRGATAPKIYLPYAQAAVDRNWGMTYVVKSNASSAALLPRLRGVVRDIDPDRVVYRPDTMPHIARAASASERFSTLLMSIFAALALTVTAVGIYGVLAVSVGQRTRELGIRAALGAEASALRRAVLGRALGLAGLGIFAGLVLLLAGDAWLGSVVPLPAVRSLWLPAAVSGLMVLVALVAAYLPARRATAVDPAQVLR